MIEVKLSDIKIGQKFKLSDSDDHFIDLVAISEPIEVECGHEKAWTCDVLIEGSFKAKVFHEVSKHKTKYFIESN